jgi:hypothetical protein
LLSKSPLWQATARIVFSTFCFPTARLQLIPPTPQFPRCLCNMSPLSNFMVFWWFTPSSTGWVLNVGFNIVSSGGRTQTFKHTHYHYLFPKASQAELKPGLTTNVRL